MISARFTYDGGHFFHRYANTEHVPAIAAHVELQVLRSMHLPLISPASPPHLRRISPAARGHVA